MKRFLKQISICAISSILAIVLIAVILLHCFPYDENDYLQILSSKIQLLEQETSKQRIVIVGGSNAAWGLNSQLLADSLGCDVINTAIHAGIGLKAMLDIYDPYAKQGDILIISPEYEHFYGSCSYGEDTFTELCYMHNFPTRKYMDLQQWLGVVSSTPTHIRNLIKLAKYNHKLTKQERERIDTVSVYQASAFNQYGDVVRHWEYDKHSLSDKAKKSQRFDTPNLDFYKWLFEYVETLKQKGVCVLFYPPSLCETTYNLNQRDIQYVGNLLQENGNSFICPIIDVIYSDTLFYDTIYHLRKIGVDKRTQHLLELLQKIRQ